MTKNTQPESLSPRSSAVRQRLLDVASGLFYSKGIRAVGIDEVIHSASVAKATMYRHFPGKEDLVVAYLQQRSAYAQSKLVESRKSNSTPVQRILDTFLALDLNIENPNFRGCAFLLAVSEHGESARVRDVCYQYKTFVHQYFIELIADAHIEQDALADQLTLVYEGALAAAVVRPHSHPGKVAFHLVEVLLAPHLQSTAQ